MRVITLCIALFFPAIALADDYSGVYLGTNADSTVYFSVHHNEDDNSVIVAVLDMSSERWNATGGQLSMMKVTTTSIFESGTFSLELDFAPTTPVLTVMSCEYGARVRCYRGFEAGTKYTLFKIL